MKNKTSSKFIKRVKQLEEENRILKEMLLKNSEEKIKEQNDLIKLIYESSPDAILFLNSSGIIEDINSAGLQLFYQNSKDTIIGKKYIHLVFDENNREELSAIQSIFDTKNSFDKKYIEHTYSGKHLGINITPLNPDNKTSGYIFNIRDISEQKRSEDSLKKSEEKLRNIIDAIPIPIFYKNRNGIYTGCNKEYAEHEGKKKEDIIGNDTLKLFPTNGEFYNATDQKIFKTRKPLSFEKEVEIMGKSHNLLVHKSFFFNPVTNEDNIIGAGIDITDRIKFEKELRESEEKFRGFVSQSSEGIVLLTFEGRILEWNKKMKELTGLREKDVEGQNLHQLIDKILPDIEFKNKMIAFMHQDIRKMLNKDISRIKNHHFETKLQHLNGNRIDCQLIVFPIQTEEVTLIACIFSNISKRKEAEANLKFLSNTALMFLSLTKKKDIYDLIYKQLSLHLPHVYVIVSEYATKKQLTVQQHGSKITDQKRKRNLKLRLEPDLIEEPYQIDGLSTKINTFKLKNLLLSKDKNMVALAQSIMEEYKTDKAYYKNLSINKKRFGNIILIPFGTNKLDAFTIETFSYQASIALYRYNIESMLKRSKTKAQQADKLKTAFLANMSHEIRTPMNGILGFAQLLLKRSDLPSEKINRFLNIIYGNSKQLLNLINDIIDISKIEARQLKIQKTKINLNQLIYQLYHFFRNENFNQSKNVDLNYEVELHDEFAEINADNLRLNQVFRNLLSNAFKFTKSGSISFGYSISEDEKFIRCFVKDTGIGIEKKDQQVIFERFKQINGTNTREFGGTGLGLAISNQLVALMGGEISIQSAPGKGSEFSFTIPFESVSSNQKTTKSGAYIKQSGNIWTNKKILVVEDDQDSFLFLESALETTGISITWVEEGFSAIELIKRGRKYDLILMDLQLPKLSGYETTREIKKIQPSIPVIAQTANAMQGDKEKAIKAGCDDYLSKPIEINDLLAKIKIYL